MPVETSTLSDEEFQRIQDQLLQLRASNYRLEEENQKQRNEIANLSQKLKNADDPLQFASKLIGRSTKKNKEVENLEEEVSGLRLKLATQEEEFRLQQSTMREEVNLVMAQSEQLQQQMQNEPLDLKTPTEDGDFESKVLELNHQLEDSNTCISALRNELTAAVEKQAETQNQVDRLMEIEKEHAACEENSKKIREQLYNEKEEHRQATLLLKQEIATHNEKYRKKQESYIQLNEEKERQYQEYKRSLDEMVRKKDAEMSKILTQLHQTKEEMKVVHEFGEKEQLWNAEKSSLDESLNSFRAEIAQLKDVNESYQMQLQETHSANDCLSTQLQAAKADVLKMEKQMEEANANAEKRKQLVDEMAEHIEEIKNENSLKVNALEETHENEISQLKTECQDARERAHTNSGLESELGSLKSQLSEENQRSSKLDRDFEEYRREVEKMRANFEKRIQNTVQEHGENMAKIQEAMTVAGEETEVKISEALKDKEICLESIARLKQEVKDRDEQLKLIDRKNKAMLKDLKRQATSEKKRADRLQEKLRDLTAEMGRNRSPGSFEELKASDVAESRRVQNDAGSVSSWSMLSGNNHKIETDRQSTNTADDNEDAESSMTALESDNTDLIDRVAALQKERYELQERVQILEDSNSAMANDLVNKSAIIEQYVKDRHVLPSAPGSPSMEQRLPGGLKKMIEMVKLDYSAADIREMNRRLQVMLEESLIKNMNLEKDLETMSLELQRLSSAAAQAR